LKLFAAKLRAWSATARSRKTYKRSLSLSGRAFSIFKPYQATGDGLPARASRPALFSVITVAFKQITLRVRALNHFKLSLQWPGRSNA
jgi:hypothetical protein